MLKTPTLTQHPRGYFVRRVNGKMRYFGKKGGSLADALKDYEFKAPYYEAGLEPPKQLAGVTLLEALDKFLIAKREKVDQGDLAEVTFKDYQVQCKSILAVLGGGRNVNSILPSDFKRLRQSFRGNVTSVGNYVVRSLVAFHWIQKRYELKFNFGDDFCRPSKKQHRIYRNSQPRRLFEAAEIHQLVEDGCTQMTALILLGINCGFGNEDCSTLLIETLELDSGWHNHGRPKTGVLRRAKLWPETVAALRTVIGNRTTGLVFKTKYGNSWSGTAVAHQFSKVRSEGSKRTFYDLRRTFQTIGDNSKDPVAVKAIMGHIDGSMSGVYRQLVPDDRLEAVSNTVYKWFTKT